MYASNTVPANKQDEVRIILMRYQSAQKISLLIIPFFMGLIVWGFYYFITQPGWTFDAGSVACALLLVAFFVFFWMCLIRFRLAKKLVFYSIPQDLHEMAFYTKKGTVRKYLSNSSSTGSLISLLWSCGPFCYIDFGNGKGLPIVQFDFSLLPNRQELCETVATDDIVEITYASHSDLMIGMHVVKAVQ